MVSTRPTRPSVPTQTSIPLPVSARSPRPVLRHRPKVMRPSSRLLVLLNSLARRIFAVSCRYPRCRSHRAGTGMGAARDPHAPPVGFSKGTAIGVCLMNRLLVKLAITAVAGGLLFFNPVVAQIPPPQKRAEHVEITKAPELES